MSFNRATKFWSSFFLLLINTKVFVCTRILSNSIRHVCMPSIRISRAQRVDIENLNTTKILKFLSHRRIIVLGIFFQLLSLLFVFNRIRPHRGLHGRIFSISIAIINRSAIYFPGLSTIVVEFVCAVYLLSYKIL